MASWDETNKILEQNVQETKRKLMPMHNRPEGIRIALDLDGVMANLLTALGPVFSAAYGKPILPHIADSWNYIDSIMPGKNMGIKYFDVWDDHDIDDIDPYERNVNVLTERLISSVERMDVVTAHRQSSHDKIQAWLKKWGVHYDNLVLAGDSKKTDNGVPKSVDSSTSADRKLQLTDKYNVFIDDNPVMAAKLPETVLLYLYDQPWNQKAELRPNMIRISSLNDIVLATEISGIA